MKRLSMLRPTFAAALCSIVTVSAAAPAEEPAKLTFNRDIRPILSENCFACHGFDAKKRQADLRLDTAENALAKRETGFAIKPGDPEASEVWKRITSDDPDTMMPPPASHKSLKPEQKAVLRRWIAEGAGFQKHWAFELPTAAVEPAVRDTAWCRNSIDRFILARLEREKLSPQPEADRPTLIRRVTFTLTGLPPTIEEVDAFLADKSPDAYERMVDRYLASPRFGEEMARHWLDVARYADTHGLHLDNERQMYAYRDWVIEAFNADLPFDQFTIWQLAGDQLPNPTPEQLTATGFNRCNVTTSEGGSIAEEFLYRYAVDRASTTMQTWLGLTGGCAVCHDHKYDPLTTKEFYSFYSFFYDAADPAMDGNISTTAPFFKLPKPGQQEALDAAVKKEATSLKELEQVAAAAKYDDPAEVKAAVDVQGAAAGSSGNAQKTVSNTAGQAGSGTQTTKQPVLKPVVDVVFDDSFPLGSTLRNTSRNASDWVNDPPFGAPSGRRVLRQANSHFFEDKVQSQLKPVVLPHDAKIEVWLRVDPQHVPEAVSVVLDAAGGSRRVWWGEESALDGGFPGMTKTERRGPLPKPGEWTKLSFAPAEFGLKEGQRITQISLQQAGGIAYWDAFTVSGKTDPATDPLASFDAWWKGAGAKNVPDVPADLQAALTAGPAKAKEQKSEQIEKLKDFYLAHVARPATKELAARRRVWEAARAAKNAAETAIAGTMIYRDMDKPRDAFVMVRGQYDKPGDKVEPAVPAVFPPLKKAQPSSRATRLDLARWLVAPEQPLTARVQVNRLWQQIFGVGLVKTSADFGSQGEVPSHPELLDWLAVRFRNDGWEMKRFVRMLVTSATFRQQARVTPALSARDPENRLLARGPRFRLDAEQIRDNVLFVSGLINLDMGGEGVKSYQPPNIWEPVGYADSNTRYYLQDHGPALYRRSIYAFLKRTAPPPFMSNFDGPNREQVCARRERSNTPLQALQLMNDVQHFEAARALAERALDEGGDSTPERITYLYRTVLARQPEPQELEIVGRALAEQLKLYKANPQAAAAAIRVGESVPQQKAPEPETAAWTLTANLILNLDETVNRN